MIDITNDMIDMARKGLPEVQGRAYRAYPQVHNRGVPFVVVSRASHMPLLTENGEEVISDLMYSVNVFAPSPEMADSLMERLTNIYNRKNIQCTSITPSYLYDADVWAEQATYSGKVDKRGVIYR